MNKTNNKKTRELIFNKYGGRCAYCGDKLEKNFHVDHIIPIFRKCTDEEILIYGKSKIRGTDTIDNYNPCCPSCNSSKSTYSLTVWRNILLFKIKRMKRDVPSFNMCLRFGLVSEMKSKVVFYFERFEKNN